MNNKYNINALRKLIIGAKILIEGTDSPNKKFPIEIIQAIIGGFEKYPNSKFWLHNQYWASSAEISKGEKNIESILHTINKKTNINI